MEVFNLNKDLVADASAEGNEIRKRVKTVGDIVAWHRSEAYYSLHSYIHTTSESIQGKRISDDIYISPNMQKLLDIFDILDSYVDETPPLDQEYRFGNKAYRNWSRRVNQDIFLLLQKAMPADKCHLVSEIGTYLSESFGNATRIDYGTGHELSFIFFLCALFKAHILSEEDLHASALRLFNKYLLLVRRLQTLYRMEPAGSQGVWALDDFQFIPFVWGSAQYGVSAPFPPDRFLDEENISKYKDENLFIGSIDYINKVKTGHFAEHSNQLWSISAVPSWSKISMGLAKMYTKDILTKFPIIQHVYFGPLMSYDPVKPGTSLKMPRIGFLKPADKPPHAPSQLSAAASTVTQKTAVTGTEKETITEKLAVTEKVAVAENTAAIEVVEKKNEANGQQ